ncbi:FlxA-like family protein [Variovorax sp. OV084]|jgi:phage shock protein A|uniref:FlxA-like family protein n=1 Tax=Variovorax sp. OV084 TaxID=1882777 RepID=UPI0008C3CE8A|nr:FlxA-like family protein [Variovorax sp. OV084]SET71026.1 FlxA-like protein [Variovorax sp. OV084]
MLNAISATGSARSGGDVNAEIAKIQRQITTTQKQIAETQGQLLGTPEGDARDAIRLQLEALAARLAMLQQQMNALRTASVQKSAMASMEESSSSGSSTSQRANAGSTSIGSMLDVKA